MDIVCKLRVLDTILHIGTINGQYYSKKETVSLSQMQCVHIMLHERNYII